MRAGIAFALLSAVLFGASTPLAKLILGPYLGAGLGLAGVSLGRRALRRPVTEVATLAVAWLVFRHAPMVHRHPHHRHRPPPENPA